MAELVTLRKAAHNPRKRTQQPKYRQKLASRNQHYQPKTKKVTKKFSNLLVEKCYLSKKETHWRQHGLRQRGWPWQWGRGQQS